MKLLDKIIEKIVEEALDKSITLIDVAKTVGDVAKQIEKTTQQLMRVTQQTNMHHKAIQELYARQETLVTMFKHDSISTEMPSIKEKPAKPN